MVTDVINFVVAHPGVFSGLGIAILDFVFAVAPNIEANGLVHWIYTSLQSLTAKK